jgi:arsenite methyltransferase
LVYFRAAFFFSNHHTENIMARADYGIDAPGVIRNLALIGLFCLLLSFVLPPITIGGIQLSLDIMLMSVGIVFVAEALLMLLYAKWGKFHHRDRMIAMLHWRGDEQVLDVGTGRGLLMIGAAKKLSTGTSVGIDIWNESDLSGNVLVNTLSNVEAEGVKHNTEVRNEDARSLSFADESFDVVLSNLCLHNISGKADRQKACREIARVLKRNGTALISDFKSTGEYEKAFRAAGLETIRTGMYWFSTFPPLRIVKAEKK